MRKGQTLWLLGLIAVFSTNFAFADTYNFFFKDKPKKSKKHDAAEGQPDVSVSDDEPSPPPTHNRKSKAINPLTAPASGHEDPGDRSEFEPGQLPPVIINNTNNIAVPPQQAPPVYAENRQEDVRSDVEVMASPPPRRSTSPSPWRFSAGINLIKEKQTGPGGTLSLAHVKERGLGFNFFAGLRDSALIYPSGKNWHFGGEMELMPIRSRETDGGVPVFEGGFLTGLSTLSAHPDNWVSLHVGARMNFNFKDNIGLAIVGRANLGYLMGEAAIITRL